MMPKHNSIKMMKQMNQKLRSDVDVRTADEYLEANYDQKFDESIQPFEYRNGNELSPKRQLSGRKEIKPKKKNNNEYIIRDVQDQSIKTKNGASNTKMQPIEANQRMSCIRIEP